MHAHTCTHTHTHTHTHIHKAPSTAAAVEEEEVDDTSPVLMTGTGRLRLGRPGGVWSCPNPAGITKFGKP